MRRWLFFLALAFVCGWNWQTHPAFVETLYYSLDNTNIKMFNLTLLREGSLAPDKDFHDNRYHHYPPSYNLSVYWLHKAEDAYRLQDFTTASYAFGVASHYISDSYAAPHNIQKESPKDHSAYEKQGSDHYLFVPCPVDFQTIQLNKTLMAATKTGELWKYWLLAKEPRYAEQPVATAMGSLYTIFYQTFNITCAQKTTTYTSASWLPSTPLTLLFFSVALYFLLETCYSLIKTK